MGLFSKKTNKEASNVEVKTAQVNLLKQSKVDLEKTIVNLSKSTGVDLSKLKARVAVVMDRSGSMEWQYRNDNVQNILTRLLPIALQFDDNGEIEVFLFQNNCLEAKPLTERNYSDYVSTYISSKKYPYGGTEYAPAVSMTDKKYNDAESKKIPTLVFFITDGENSSNDKNACNKAIIESAEHGIFYAFIGTGNDSFSYLSSLDDLSGRSVDNTGFMKVSDLNTTSNTELFFESLKDFVPWLKTKNYI